MVNGRKIKGYIIQDEDGDYISGTGSRTPKGYHRNIREAWVHPDVELEETLVGIHEYTKERGEGFYPTKLTRAIHNLESDKTRVFYAVNISGLNVHEVMGLLRRVS